MEYNGNNALKIEYFFFTYLRIKGKKRWKRNICFEK